VFSVTRRWLHQFNAIGIDGLGNRPGCGRKQRITEAERSRIIALARSLPRGQLARDVTGELSTDMRPDRRNGREVVPGRLGDHRLPVQRDLLLLVVVHAVLLSPRHGGIGGMKRLCRTLGADSAG